METLEYLAYAGILFGMLVSAFTIDWKNKKNIQKFFDYPDSYCSWNRILIPH